MKQENKEKKLKNLIRQNLRYQLALESYTDDTQEESPFLKENLKKLSAWRKNRTVWSIDKQIQETKIYSRKFSKNSTRNRTRTFYFL